MQGWHLKMYSMPDAHDRLWSHLPASARPLQPHKQPLQPPPVAPLSAVLSGCAHTRSRSTSARHRNCSSDTQRAWSALPEPHTGWLELVLASDWAAAARSSCTATPPSTLLLPKSAMKSCGTGSRCTEAVVVSSSREGLEQRCLDRARGASHVQLSTAHAGHGGQSCVAHSAAAGPSAPPVSTGTPPQRASGCCGGRSPACL